MKTDQEIQQYYSARLRESGPTYRAGDHGSGHGFVLRASALREVWNKLDLTHGWHIPASVLDVGCGTAVAAALWSHHASYEGWDFTPAFASERVKTRDLMHSTEHLAYDYVVASGLFQFRSTSYLYDAVARMYALCRRAVAFNFLTIADGTPGETAHDPIDVLRFCWILTPTVVLRMDYLPNDATVYLYRS